MGGTPAARGVRNYTVGEAIGPTKQYRPQDKPQPTKTEDEITGIYAGRRYDDGPTKSRSNGSLRRRGRGRI